MVKVDEYARIRPVLGQRVCCGRLFRGFVREINDFSPCKIFI